jgi:signal transduction histidine kinase
MNIKLSLTLRFLILVAMLLASFSLVVYENYSRYRQDDYYERLRDRSETIARHIIHITDPNLLDEVIERENVVKPMPNHRVSVYSISGFFLGDSNRIAKLPYPNIIDDIREKNYVELSIKETYYTGFVMIHNGQKFIVICSGTDFVGAQKLNFLGRLILVSLFIALIITAVLGWFFAHQALNPISKVITEVDQITANNLDMRLPIGKQNDEIWALNKTFNKMLDRLEASFLMQKNFVSNASHEFITPITAIKAQIEVMLIQERSKEEYINTLKSIDEDIDHFMQLISSLGELASANVNNLDNKLNKVPLIEIIAESRAELIKGKPNYIIKLHIENLPEQEHENYVPGNAALLKSAFKNVMENACKFSSDFTCDVSMIFVQPNIIVTISDNGIGIKEKELKLIFEPFYRANDTRGIGGYGIGLSLVKKIIDLHKGTIQVESVPTKGTKVVIKLPHAKSENSSPIVY